MKHLFIGLFTLFSLHSLSQNKYIITIADKNIAIYQNPQKDPFYANILDAGTYKVPEGETVYCVGKLKAKEGSSVKYWLAVAYKDTFGFASPFGLFRPNNEDIETLPDYKPEFKEFALQLSRSNYTKDSLARIQKRVDDSLWKIQTAIDKRKKDVLDSIQEAKDRIADSIAKVKIIKSAYANGLAILTHDYDESDYGLIDFSVGVMNLSQKTIKYIWFTVTIYNPVNDAIQTKTFKGVGPIYYQDTGAYNFESGFYTKVFGYGSIKNIKIQYMDGSTKSLTGSTIKNIIYPG